MKNVLQMCKEAVTPMHKEAYGRMFIVLPFIIQKNSKQPTYPSKGFELCYVYTMAYHKHLKRMRYNYIIYMRITPGDIVRRKKNYKFIKTDIKLYNCLSRNMHILMVEEVLKMMPSFF